MPPCRRPAASGSQATRSKPPSAARVRRVILYRHFDSQADLYRQVLDRVCTRLAAACGRGDFSDGTLPALVDVAAQDPDGFRLLLQHAAREPEVRDEMVQS